MSFSIRLIGLLLLASVASAQSRLTNVSVRSAAGSGADTLIVGFMISGTGQKAVLVRGIGPALVPYGVANAVADPKLKLFGDSARLVAENEDWGGSDSLTATFAAVGAFPLAVNSRDAAMLQSLASGAYSVHLASGSGTGVALVEAYDADPNSIATLSNVSARSMAGTGADVLTIGFGITGNVPKTVLIRAIGPTLGSYGVSGTLADPTLRLFKAGGTELALNDDWWPGAGWAAAFAAVGAFPLQSGTADAALLVKLAPGSYTAQARGAGTSTGIALIEVYDVPSAPAQSLVLEPVANARPESFRGEPTPPGSQITNPVVTSQTPPGYPFALRRAGVTGEVVVDFIIGTSGRVTDAIAIRATDVRFADAALLAVKQWVFTPRKANGVAVATLMEVPIIFTLDAAAVAAPLPTIAVE